MEGRSLSRADHRPVGRQGRRRRRRRGTPVVGVVEIVPLRLVRNLLLRSRVELLLLCPRPRPTGRDGDAVGPPAVGGAITRAVGARRARPGAHGGALLQLEHRLTAVGLGSLKNIFIGMNESFTFQSLSSPRIKFKIFHTTELGGTFWGE